MNLAAVLNPVVSNRRWPRQAVRLIVAGVAICVVAVAEFELASRYSEQSLFKIGSDILFGVSWTAVGLAVHVARPQDLTGRLLIAAGIGHFLSGPGGFGLPTDLDFRWLATIAWAIGWWIQIPLVARILLGFPTGRVTDPVGRAYLRAVDLLAITAATTWLLMQASDRSVCHDRCQVSPISLNDDPALSRLTYSAGMAALGVAVLVGVVIAARRYASGSRRSRRVQRLGAAVTIAIACLFGLFSWLAASAAGFGGPQWMVYVLAYLVALAIPALLGIGAIQHRLAQARVADALGSSGALSVEALEPALAAALDDPSLRIGYPSRHLRPDDYVDWQGHSLSGASPQLSVTRIDNRSGELAVLLHDPELLEHPELLDTAVAAARLTIENASMRARLEAQLVEVRESRARIIAAADRERQRMERNLHDGAQQHLLGIGLSLTLLRSNLTEGAHEQAQANLTQAEQDLHAAIADLRRLAQGLHPAVLDDQGLIAALGVVARLSAIPVTVSSSLGSRLPAPVESALYYACAEAIQNVNKHSSASTARIRVWAAPGLAGVEVTDDGRGGAVIGDSRGLRGLVDRIEAAGGSLTLDSPEGGGTTVRVVVPCT